MRNSHFTCKIFSGFYCLSTLLLLFSINTSPDLYSEIYLLGGSCRYSSVGVEGVFKLSFIIALIVASFISLLAFWVVVLVRKISYILIALLTNIILIILNGLFTQFHAFRGYKFDSTTDMFDAISRHCYVYEGPHYLVLFLISVLGICFIWLSRKRQ